MSAPATLEAPLFESIVGCRSCGHPELEVFLDLGVTPLADRLVPEAERGAEEITAPLKVAVCPCCSLVQITETVRPEILFFEDYPYYSSVSEALVEHARRNVEDVIARRGLSADSFVVELASNDGYLLQHYMNRGVPVLGVDPAPGPAMAAQHRGVPTDIAFFDKALAQRFRDSGRLADVVHANNVLAHVADTNGFVAGLRLILKDTGVAVIEAPYVKPLIDYVEFDTIYHQHLCYFSVTALDHLFRRHGLYLNDIRHLEIHGGSLRLFVEPQERVQESVRRQLALEADIGLTSTAYYARFAERVATVKTALKTMLRDLKAQGLTIAAYGAAAKGATLINHIGLGTELIDYVVDRNPHKHGKYMPGQGLPIRPVSALMDEKPDVVLLLAWNFADEILAQQKEFRAQGGRFIIPVPEPKLV